MGLGHHRPDFDVVAGAGFADDQGGYLADQLVDELLGDRGVHEYAAAGAAFLAGVPVAGCPQRGGGGGQIGVGEDQHRGFAAEFEVDPLQRVGRRFGDCAAGGHRAGQRDHVEVRVGGQSAADLGP